MSRLLLLLALAGCSESEFNFGPAAQPVGELVVSGQACDAERQVWLEDALVYTHLFDDAGIVFDTRTDTTDASGQWELTGLAGGYDYEIYVQKGQAILEQFTVSVPNGESIALPPPACFGDTDLQVAVISGAYDDMETVLALLGIEGYRLVDGQQGDEIVDFLSDPANLADYQVVFFDGGHKEADIIHGTDPAVAAVHDTLRSYVEGGGVLYATDWSYDVVEQIWPDQIDFLGDDLVPDSAQTGEPGTVVAAVVDQALQGALGFPSANVVYDMSEWPVIEDVAEGTLVYLQGDAPYREGFDVLTITESPLLVEFTVGSGRVIVSTFRNSANSTGETLAVLSAMIGSIQ